MSSSCVLSVSKRSSSSRHSLSASALVGPISSSRRSSARISRSRPLPPGISSGATPSGMRVRISSMRACSSSASRAMSSRLPSRVPAFSRASILASSRATSRFAPSLEPSRKDGGVLLSGTRKTLLLGELRHLIGLGGAGYVEQPRGLLGTYGAGRARPEVRQPRLRLPQPLPRIGSLGGLGFEDLEAIPQLAPAHVDGHSWVGPGPDEARLPIDAVEGDLFAHHHLSEQAASDPLVAGLGADVLEKGPGARLWGGRREKQRELTVRLG